MASSRIDDFVHVDVVGAQADSNIQSQGSEESVVADNAANDAVSGEGEPRGYVRKALPDKLMKSVVMLSCESYAEGGICDVYLLGTAHVSAESCQQVQAVINFLKPQAVFLELCSSRVAILTPRNLKPSFFPFRTSPEPQQNISEPQQNITFVHKLSPTTVSPPPPSGSPAAGDRRPEGRTPKSAHVSYSAVRSFRIHRTRRRVQPCLWPEL